MTETLPPASDLSHVRALAASAIERRRARSPSAPSPSADDRDRGGSDLGRLLRRRYSEHNRRRMEEHRSLPTLAPMSQQHAWELLQKLAGRAGFLEGSGGHATIPPYMLRHSCTTLAFDKGVWRA